MAWNGIIKRIRSINAKLTVVGRIYGRDSKIYRNYVSIIQRAGGTGERFNKKMFEGSLRQIAKAERALSTIENSPYTSKAGRKTIGLKARQTFAFNHSDYSDAAIQDMYYVFENSSFSKLGEYFKGYSELYVDAIMNAFEDTDASAKDIAEKVDYFVHNLDSFSNDFGVALEQFKDML